MIKIQVKMKGEWVNSRKFEDGYVYHDKASLPAQIKFIQDIRLVEELKVEVCPCSKGCLGTRGGVKDLKTGEEINDEWE